MGNIDGVVAIVVHQAAGGGDYDLAARFQLALLLVQPGAAVYADDLDVRQELRQVLQVLGDLLGQLAGGAQDDSLGLQAGGVHLGQDGDAERHGFAGAGGGLGNHIVAVQHQRDGLLLDLGHFGKAHGLRSLQDLGRNAGKFRKLHVCTAFRLFYTYLLL